MFTRQDMQDMALGRWIRENPTKTFALAKLEGVHCFKPEFIPNDGKLCGNEAGQVFIDEAI